MPTPLNAKTIYHEDYEDAERFDPDNPAHLLAYIRATAYSAAEAADKLRTEALALQQLPAPHRPTDFDLERQLAMANRHLAWYLRILADTLSLGEGKGH